MALDKLAIAMFVTGLFIFSFFSFVIITQNQNNPDNSILDNEVINSTYNDLYSNLSGSNDIAQNALSNFNNVTPTTSYGTVDIIAVVSPVQTIETMINSIPKILIELPMKILGVDEVVVAVIWAILFIVLIIGAWAIIKGVIS